MVNGAVSDLVGNVNLNGAAVSLKYRPKSNPLAYGAVAANVGK